MQYIEDAFPMVKYNGLNTLMPIDFSGAPSCLLPAGTTIGGVAAMTAHITSSSITALSVGQNGATNPAFNVDASTASSATGINVKSAAAGSGVELKTISSGTNESMGIDAKGTGAVVIGGVSTGLMYLGKGSGKVIITQSTLTALGTTQNSTPTAAQLLGGILTQTGATGAGTVTLPTGTLLSGAVPAVAVGSTFKCLFANLGGSETLTITGATGSTVIGTAAIASGENAEMTFVNTGTNAWDVFVIVSA